MAALGVRLRLAPALASENERVQFEISRRRERVYETFVRTMFWLFPFLDNSYFSRTTFSGFPLARAASALYESRAERSPSRAGVPRSRVRLRAPPGCIHRAPLLLLLQQLPRERCARRCGSAKVRSALVECEGEVALLHFKMQTFPDSGVKSV